FQGKQKRRHRSDAVRSHHAPLSRNAIFQRGISCASLDHVRAIRIPRENRAADAIDVAYMLRRGYSSEEYSRVRSSPSARVAKRRENRGVGHVAATCMPLGAYSSEEYPLF